MLAERAISVPPAHPPHPRAEAITDLRAAIDRIERRSFDVRADSHIVGLGDDGIDAALPWGGLPRGALHEVVAGDAGAGLGFVATLLGRLTAAGDGRGQRVLWCLPPAGLYETGNLYAPALAAHGLDPGHVLLARGRRDTDIRWAMEEGLRCPALAAVVGEVRDLDLTAGRRLQLAAQRSGVTALFLAAAVGGRAERQAPSAAVTRWRVASTSADAPAAGSRHGPAWRLELVRCRGGLPRQWRVAFDVGGRDRAGKGVPYVPGRVRVVAEVGDRSPAPAASAAGLAVPA